MLVSGVAAVYRVPAGCAALLLVGAGAAVTQGALSAGWVLVLAAVVVAVVGVTGDLGATLFVAGAAWLTAAGFSRPPFVQFWVPRACWGWGVPALAVAPVALDPGWAPPG